jgi:hypothetical protein
MTEAEWLECPHPDPMMDYLLPRISNRRIHLLACACCRRFWHLLPDERSRRAIEVMEKFMDGVTTVDEYHVTQAAAERATRSFQEQRDRTEKLHFLAAYAVEWAVEKTLTLNWDSLSLLAANTIRLHAIVTGPAEEREMETDGRAGGPYAMAAERSGLLAHAALVRDIFGNPFRPVTFPPDWRTEPAVSIARQMYDAREFSAMPILADALQDAGCDSADILDHCRGPGPHVRGCWVVDLVLGKE